MALSEALGLLPTTLRRANTTFVNLRATLDDLDVLVAESKPATKDLAPFLRDLLPLLEEAKPTIHDLRLLVRRPGPENDLVEATRELPPLQRVATPAFRNGRQALQRLQPVLEFIRPYTPEITGWLRDFGPGARPTTTRTATTRGSSRSSTPSSSRTTRRAACSRRWTRTSASTAT